jgi:hypothetical protein
MNTSWFSIGQYFITILALVQTAMILIQFRFPRSSVTFLIYLISLSVLVLMCDESLKWMGIHIIFRFPSFYGLLISLFSWSWLGVTLFTFADNTTRVHEKLLWRVPILGALLGYYLSLEFLGLIFLVTWLVAFGVQVYKREKFRLHVRIYISMFILTGAYYFCTLWDYTFLLWVCKVSWIILLYKMLSLYLIQDRIKRLKTNQIQGSYS